MEFIPILVIIAIVFLITRNTIFKKVRETANSEKRDLSIPLDAKTDKKMNDELHERMIHDIQESGFFKPEKLVEISKRIKKFYRMDVYERGDIFSYKDVLALEEKRLMGLNTREKISREMVDFLTETGKKEVGMKYFIPTLKTKYSHIIMNGYHLARYKDDGVKFIKISRMNDGRDCEASKAIDGKIYPIDEVPALPLPDCTEPYCRCMYSPLLQSQVK